MALDLTNFLMKDENVSRGLSFGGKLYAIKNGLAYITKKGVTSFYPYENIAAVNEQRGTMTVSMDNGAFLVFAFKTSSAAGWVSLIKGIKSGDVSVNIKENKPENTAEHNELDDEFDALFSDEDFE